MMKPSGKMILVVAPLFALGVFFLAGCHYHENGGNGYYGHGGNKPRKGICYTRVLDIDKKTGKATYRERAIPCKKKNKNKY